MLRLGSDAGTAARRALRLLDYQVLRQAGVLAYNHVFALVAALFMLGVPLVLLLRRGEVEEGTGVMVEE
jgi:DHA2 family multidrug resistance protein